MAEFWQRHDELRRTPTAGPTPM